MQRPRNWRASLVAVTLLVAPAMAGADTHDASVRGVASEIKVDSDES